MALEQPFGIATHSWYRDANLLPTALPFLIHPQSDSFSSLLWDEKLFLVLIRGQKHLQYFEIRKMKTHFTVEGNQSEPCYFSKLA